MHPCGCRLLKRQDMACLSQRSGLIEIQPQDWLGPTLTQARVRFAPGKHVPDPWVQLVLYPLVEEVVQVAEIPVIEARHQIHRTRTSHTTTQSAVPTDLAGASPDTPLSSTAKHITNVDRYPQARWRTPELLSRTTGTCILRFQFISRIVTSRS